jgi:hypothetical protein
MLLVGGYLAFFHRPPPAPRPPEAAHREADREARPAAPARGPAPELQEPARGKATILFRNFVRALRLRDGEELTFLVAESERPRILEIAAPLRNMTAKPLSSDELYVEVLERLATQIEPQVRAGWEIEAVRGRADLAFVYYRLKDGQNRLEWVPMRREKDGFRVLLLGHDDPEVRGTAYELAGEDPARTELVDLQARLREGVAASRGLSLPEIAVQRALGEPPPGRKPTPEEDEAIRAAFSRWSGAIVRGDVDTMLSSIDAATHKRLEAILDVERAPGEIVLATKQRAMEYLAKSLGEFFRGAGTAGIGIDGDVARVKMVFPGNSIPPQEFVLSRDGATWKLRFDGPR